jgi:hypothetical protein
MMPNEHLGDDAERAAYRDERAREDEDLPPYRETHDLNRGRCDGARCRRWERRRARALRRSDARGA